MVVSSTHHHERDSFMVDHNLCFEEIAVKLAEISILWGFFCVQIFVLHFLFHLNVLSGPCDFLMYKKIPMRYDVTPQQISCLCLNVFHLLAQKPNLEEEKNLFKQILS
jgi:hypothetical protein